MIKRVVIRTCVVLFILSVTGHSGIAQSLKTPKEAIADFMAKRFGMFIHYGPVTLRGTEISSSRNREISRAEYDSLYKEFKPALFNADEWVRTAKDAGMKYLTITAKHHDGFCLWPTATSDYHIMNSGFKTDILEELSKACKKQNIAFCVYFSILDWYDPDYPVSNPYDLSPNRPGNMTRFTATIKEQLKEIITRYKPYMLWFDGNWEKPWTKEYGEDIYQYIKKLDRNIIVNNRLGKGSHTSFDEGSVGDYLTPEQRIGKMNMIDPWESCITICNQWAWKPNDGMKSLKECIQTLVKTAGGNGNLLLNVGPMMDGRIEARQIRRLKEVGDWLKQYGESIYETKGGPFPPGETYASTRKKEKIYIQLFEKKSNILLLPVLKSVHIKKVSFLGKGQLKYDQDVFGALSVELPEKLPDNICSVIVLELDKSADDLPILSGY